MSQEARGGVTLARPVEVRQKGLYAALNGCLFVLLVGLGVGVIAVNGFKPMGLAIALLNVAILVGVLLIQRRASRKSARLLDASGVTCGGGQRLEWRDFQGVDYLMVRTSPSRTALWRVELVFTSGNAWILPNRAQNWEEIRDFIATLPGAHRERPA